MNTQFQKILFTLICFFSVSVCTPPAYAGLTGWSDIFSLSYGVCNRVYRRFIVEPLSHRLDNTDLLMDFSDPEFIGKPTKIRLGQQLGSGTFGEVYDVDAPALPDGTQVVVKVPHALAGTKEAYFPLSKQRQQEELDFFLNLQSRTQGVESHPSYPKDPSWEKGKMPAMNIILAGKSDYGLVLFKQKARGKNLDKIREQHGTKLTGEMKRALREIYDLAQALHQAKGITLDLKPDNLEWADNPLAHRNYNLRRNGFGMDEITEISEKPYPYGRDQLSFEQYVDLFETYLAIP